MYADPIAARAFIRQQIGEFTLQGITTMTAKQLERIERGEVISDDQKHSAGLFLDATRRFYGMAPRGARLRRSNLFSGEIDPNVPATVPVAA